MRFDKFIKAGLATVVALGSAAAISAFPALENFLTPELQTTVVVAAAATIGGVVDWALAWLFNKLPWLKSILSLGKA